MSFFQPAFEIVVGIEAGLTKDPQDPGNWTGGKVGAGLLKGTKYGISAASYPNLDIEQLTIEQAQGIYRRDFWNPAGCEAMSWERALCAFDCAVNQGEHAEELLSAKSPDAVEFMTQRALRYASSPKLPRYGHSWFHRLLTIFKAAQRTP